MYNELGIIRMALFCLTLYDSALILNMSKMALNPFCDETLQLHFKLNSLGPGSPILSHPI